MSKTVDIDNGSKVVEFVVSSKVSSFPNGTFNGFTISHHTVVSVRDFINVFRGISHTTGDRKTLSEGSSTNIDEVELRSRVSFKRRVDSSKGRKTFLGKESIVIPEGV